MDDDDLPAVTLKEKMSPTSSPNSEREEGGKLDTSVADSKSPFVVNLHNQESELFPDTLQAHSNTGSQPLGDITNITTSPDVFQTTECPQSMEKKHTHSRQSEELHTALTNNSPPHSESSVDHVHTVDLTGNVYQEQLT